ncbi:MAG: transposase [Gammaproteobacteria bacterium]|nr:transposase [Gammaproteobacteria bacterium]
MILNDAGRMVVARWLDLAQRFTGIGLNEYTVMPNHFHGIIELLVGVPLVGTQNEDTQNMGQPQPERQPQPGQPQGIAPTVGDIVGAFKSITTNEYIHGVKQNHWPRFDKKLWQRNFYEHIVRDEESYLKISEYIKTNPAKWQDDTYYA